MLGTIIAIVCLAALAFFSAPLWLWVAVGILGLLTGVFAWWFALPWLAVCALLGVALLRMKFVSRPAFKLFKNILPPLSATEQAAIDAGTVWWDAEIFNGKPDWLKLSGYRDPKLTEEEQSFIDNETETLCQMLNDWRFTHHDKDLPPEVWQYVKDQGFIAMIIDKKYGGKQFSHYAHAKSWQPKSPVAARPQLI